MVHIICFRNAERIQIHFLIQDLNKAVRNDVVIFKPWLILILVLWDYT